MNAAAKAPALTDEAVLKLVQDAGPGGTTAVMLAEDLDVAPQSFALRRTVFALADRRLIRVVERYGQPDLLVAANPARGRRRK